MKIGFNFAIRLLTVNEELLLRLQPALLVSVFPLQSFIDTISLQNTIRPKRNSYIARKKETHYIFKQFLVLNYNQLLIHFNARYIEHVLA